MLGTPELLIILFLVLLLFGGKKLPELARSLGSAIREFNKSSRVDSEEAKPPQRKSGDEEDRAAIIDTAKKMGIETEGRSIKEIADDLVKTANRQEETA